MLKTAYIHGQINALERFGVDPLEAQALLKTAAGGGALGSPAVPDVAPGYLTEQIARARGASAAAPAATPAVITPSAPAGAAHVPPSVPVAVPAPSPAAGIPAAQGDLVEQLAKAESGKVPPGPKAPGAWFSKLRNSKVPLVGGLGLGTAIGAGLLIHGMRNPEMEVTPSAPIAPLMP